MTDRNTPGKPAELSPIELYSFITSDRRLQQEVVSVARSLAPRADSLIAAMLVLGFRTVTEIATAAVIELGINGDRRLAA